MVLLVKGYIFKA